MYPSLLLFAEAPTSAILLGLKAASPQSLIQLPPCHPKHGPCHPERGPCHPERGPCHPERSEGSAQVLLRPDRPSRRIGLYVAGNRRGIQFLLSRGVQ